MFNIQHLRPHMRMLQLALSCSWKLWRSFMPPWEPSSCKFHNKLHIADWCCFDSWNVFQLSTICNLDAMFMLLGSKFCASTSLSSFSLSLYPLVFLSHAPVLWFVSQFFLNNDINITCKFYANISMLSCRLPAPLKNLRSSINGISIIDSCGKILILYLLQVSWKVKREALIAQFNYKRQKSLTKFLHF